MGGGVSTLPEFMSEQEFQQACGDQYNPVYYTALKNADHRVGRDLFASVATDGPEKEVFNLFLSFCHGGEMDSRTFTKMLKDSKSLSKKFSSGQADIIFDKYKKAHGNVKALNYYVFRTNMVPDVAEKRGTTVDKYILKLSHCEGPHLHATTAQANRFHDDKSTYTGAHAQGGPSFDNASGAVALQSHLNREEANVRGVMVKGEEIEITDDHHGAALRLQNVHRSKQAKKHVEALKEIKQEVENLNPDTDFDRPTEGCDTEAGARQTFLKFSPNGEMESKTFIKMCEDCGLVGKKFSRTDGDLLFQKAKAKASHPSAGAYSGGVVHGKRLTYDVLRAVAIPEIAAKRGATVTAILEAIAACPGPTLRGTTQAQANRFHDDKTTYTGAHAAPH